MNITLQKNNGHLYGDTNSKSNLKSDADHTAHFSKELNDRKIKFYQAFRSQELSSYYISLINREEKFVPEKFRVKVNSNTPGFEMNLKHKHSIQNVLNECETLDGRCKEFYKIIQNVDITVLENINALEKDETVKKQIIESYKNACRIEEDKSKDIWFINFNKLKSTYEKEMENGTQFLLKIEPETDEKKKKQHQRKQKKLQPQISQKQNEIVQPESTKIINFSDYKLTDGQVQILKYGLTFTPTPKFNLDEIENDLYQYTKRLRLVYIFRDKQSTEKNESFIKLKSNWSPYLTDNTEFENIIRTLTNISFTYKPVKDNLKGLRDDLDDLVYATQTGKIVIKKADKGSIITIMSSPFYWDMCLNHLNNTEYYEKVANDPS